jgi:hypothetical protein
MDLNMPKARTAMVLGAFLLAAAPAVVTAQTAASGSASSGKTATIAQKVTASATVMAIDVSNRHVLVQTAAGDKTILKIPPNMTAIDSLRPGDKIKATYYRETAYAVSEPGKPLPDNTATLLAGRAAKGELPAGLVANHIVVSGAVVGIDTAKSTIKVVDPKGGEVHDFDVVTDEGKQLLAKMKVGDKITAYITEALALSVDRG